MLHYPSIHTKAFLDPETFDPTRFDPKSPEFETKYANDNRKAFCTFAGGSRSCIGMKVNARGANFQVLLSLKKVNSTLVTLFTVCITGDAYIAGSLK